MKKLTVTILAFLFAAGWSLAGAQNYPDEYLGLPGDNLNLYAVMKLFQESKTLEEFERDLNSENSRINNLDLNGDNLVDYLMVKDYQDGNVHTIVIRAALERNVTQDVAVFTVQQFGDGAVQVQLVGDEALYGPNYIVEPVYADESITPNPGYVGANPVTVVRTTTYEVAAWPVIRFIYRPTYVVWHSRWHWGIYPDYWNPWHPFYWHTYYGYHSHWHHHYYAHYRHWDHYRYHGYHDYYYSRVRTYSPTVIVNINKNYYHDTYSRPDLRNQGDRLYASTHSGRNTAGLSSSRNGSGRSAGISIVRNDGSARNKSGAAVRSSGNGASSRSSSLKSGDRSSVSRRSSVAESTRGADVKSGTRSQSNTGRATVRSSSSSDRPSVRSSSSGNRPSVRSSSPENKSGVRSSGERGSSSSRVNKATQARRPEATAPARSTVRSPQTKSGDVYTRPSARSGQRSGSSPAVRQSSPQRSQPSVSRGSATHSRPSVKSGSMGSPSRSSESTVRSSRSSQRSAPSVSRSSGSSRSSSPSISRSSGSSRSSSPSVRSSSPQRSQPATRSSSRSSSGERAGRR